MLAGSYSMNQQYVPVLIAVWAEKLGKVNFFTIVVPMQFYFCAFVPHSLTLLFLLF